MKIWKNLFGKNDKIHVDEIAYKDLQGIARLLSWGIIKDSGSNQDGHYIVLGNGYKFCWRYLADTENGLATWGEYQNMAKVNSTNTLIEGTIVNFSSFDFPIEFDDLVYGGAIGGVGRGYGSVSPVCHVSNSGWLRPGLIALGTVNSEFAFRVTLVAFGK